MTVEVLSPPDIEKALTQWLTRITGVRTVTRVPNPRPDLFLQVQRIGGTPVNLIQDAPIVLVQAWGNFENTDLDSTAGAADLATSAYQAMRAMQGQFITPYCLVHSVRVSGPVNSEDTLSRSPRYHLTATLRTRMLTTDIDI